jgi:hypothetical protein
MLAALRMSGRYRFPERIETPGGWTIAAAHVADLARLEPAGVVELSGIEPLASAVRLQRSPI